MSDTRRPPMFAAKFVRVMTRCAAAQDLGPSVCWMLAVISSQEDAPSVRYRRPVSYYFDQLMPLCGFRSRKQLSAAIAKAVAAGWLEYTPGAKARPGKFRVLVPDSVRDVEDYGCDESEDHQCSSESEPETPHRSKCSSESEPERERKRNCKGNESGTAKGAPSSPSPTPTPEEAAASGESPSAAKAGKKKRKPKAAAFDPLKVDLPSPLDTDRFKAAWQLWVAHRREIRKPLTPTTTSEQIKRLAEMGERRAVAAIEHPVAQGWTGLREPDTNGSGSAEAASSYTPNGRPLSLSDAAASSNRGRSTNGKP